MKYCSKCGKEVMDDSVICPGCGCPQSNMKLQKQEVKIIKILSCVSIICFFMPFVAGSVFGFKFSLSGLETAFGIPLNSIVGDMVSLSDLRMNMFVFFSMISCIIAMISAFQKNNAMKSVLGYNIISVVLLILYLVTYNLYYKNYDFDMFLSLEYGFAICVLLILNIVIAILAYRILSKNDRAELNNESFREG